MKFQFSRFFVKEGKEWEFYKRVSKEMNQVCCIYTRQQVLENKLFGNGDDDKFLERLGNFIMLPKDWYTISDIDDWMLWNHWWASDREVLVPLILFG